MIDADRAAEAEEYAPEAREPAGYHHSDAGLKEQVRRALAQADGLDASGIVVDVLGGEVTLSGRVRHCADMQRAEQLACATAGVKLVRNGLTPVEPPAEAIDGKQAVGAAPKMGKPSFER
jgi:osmotically-inducible protein OsmY